MLPCFADNSIQRKMQQEFWSNPKIVERFNSIAKVVFTWEDYQTWKSNTEALTTYGDLLAIKKKYCSLTDVISSNNCKYAILATNNFVRIGEIDVFSGVDEIEKARKVLKDYPIIVDDSVIKDLDERLLQIILLAF